MNVMHLSTHPGLRTTPEHARRHRALAYTVPRTRSGPRPPGGGTVPSSRGNAPRLLAADAADAAGTPRHQVVATATATHAAIATDADDGTAAAVATATATDAVSAADALTPADGYRR